MSQLIVNALLYFVSLASLFYSPAKMCDENKGTPTSTLVLAHSFVISDSFFNSVTICLDYLFFYSRLTSGSVILLKSDQNALSCRR